MGRDGTLVLEDFEEERRWVRAGCCEASFAWWRWTGGRLGLVRSAISSSLCCLPFEIPSVTLVPRSLFTTQGFQSLSAALSQAAGSPASTPAYKTPLKFPREGRVFRVGEKNQSGGRFFCQPGCIWNNVPTRGRTAEPKRNPGSNDPSG